MTIGNTISQVTIGAVVAFEAEVMMLASSDIFVKGDISRNGFHPIKLGAGDVLDRLFRAVRWRG